MERLLEKYLLRSIPREGEGGNGGDGGSLISVIPKAPVLDLSAIGADMDVDPKSVERFIVQEDNTPVNEMEEEPAWAEYVPDEKKTEAENAVAKAEHDKTKPAEEKPAEGEKPAGKAKEAGKQADDKAAKKAEDGDEDGELPAWVKRRLDRQERKHQRELSEAREAATKAKAAEEEGGKAKDPGPTPVASDYDDFESFLEAKALHEKSAKAFREGKAAKPPEKKGEPKKADEGKPDTELIAAIEDIQAVLTDTAPDLWKKVTEKTDLQISRDMALSIAEAKYPHSVLQVLLDKPAEAERISKLSPRRQAIELDKLDVKEPAKAETPPKEKKETTPPKKPSSAPAPIEPLDGKTEADRPYGADDFSAFEQRRAAEEKAAVGTGKDFWL